MFKRKKPQRLYYPTKSRWYRKPKKRRPTARASRKIFSHNIRTHVSRFIKDAFLYVLAFLILVALFVFLVFSSRFSIANIEVARDDLHIDSTAVSRLLDEYRGKSIFTFSKLSAQRKIQEAYPEFSKVTVRKLLPNSIRVELETHEIVANVRAYYVLPKAETPLLEEEDAEIKELNEAFRAAFDLEGEANEEKEVIAPIEQKAMLNSIGQAIFDQSENLELMTFRVEGLTQPVEDRQIVVERESMDYILNSIKYITNLMQVEVSGVKYYPVAREVHLLTDNNLTLWLTLEKSYKDQLDKLHAIYDAAELSKEDLAYIDLRVKEKLIYCPRRTSCDK